MRGLKRKTAIVTNGLGDLGFACARRLVEEGCLVAMFDMREDPDNYSGKLGGFHYPVNITSEVEVDRACRRVKEELGPVAILVNAAVSYLFKSVDATPQEWDQVLRASVIGASLMAKHVVPQMIQQGRGSIINFSSIGGFVGQPNYATHNTAMFATRGLAKSWAHDLAPFGIRVNAVCPGHVYTLGFVNQCHALGRDPQQEDQRLAAMNLLNRQGQAEEIAAAVAFLASDDASFITGTDLIVDGGYLAR